MTMDKSLRLGSRLVRRRNVLKRDERVEKLADAGKWREGDSVFGLPKVKTMAHTAKSYGKAEKKQAAAEGVEGAAETPAETPPAPPAGKKAR